jgi:hypothetical protein
VGRFLDIEGLLWEGLLLLGGWRFLRVMRLDSTIFFKRMLFDIF